MDDLIVDGLAAARITRLVTQDTFPPAKAAREAWVRRFGQGSSLAELIECGWCAGFWIAAGCRVARRVAPRWWGPVAEVFAVAMVGSYFVGKSTEEGDPKDVAEAIEQSAGVTMDGRPVTPLATVTKDGRPVLVDWPLRQPLTSMVANGEAIWQRAREVYETDPHDPVEVDVEGGGVLSIPRAWFDTEDESKLRHPTGFMQTGARRRARTKGER